jgi:hypothetical protein
MFPQFKDKNWITDLAFLADMLGTSKQGKDLLVYTLYTAVQAFKTELFVLKTRYIKYITHFPTLQRMYVSCNATNNYSNISSNYMKNSVNDLDFNKIENKI